MDFWSRLLAHTPLSSSSAKKDAAKDPVRRLHRFEKEYGQVLQIWRNSSNLMQDEEAAEDIEVRVQELTNILSDESRRPLPHPCITFAAAKQIYIPIGKIATTSYNEWIIEQAVYFFATLIESEEEAFVENHAFATSLTNLLVRITGPNSIRLSAETETRVVELAFNITTKIRLDPEILPAWFRSQQQQQQQQQPPPPPPKSGEPLAVAGLDKREKFAGKTQKQDFPLFYILMDYIHHEGKVGDFARTGLLYIIESASSSVPLEQWIVESDLSTLMATGLGALYSQLSRKLVIDHPNHDLPPILALSDYDHPKSTYEIVSSCSPDFQIQLDTFLSHLLFWQDVLNHCRSVDVKSTLLEHFQVIFLQQLLYPSLLESSDIDGGSSVAVLTYLRRILESLDHPDMINLILHYLLALPEVASSAPSGSRSSVSAARKRKSMDLATMMAAKAEPTATPLLFNLVDLILACLRSHSQQTIHVTLQLVSAILKRHHRYAVITLIHTEPVPGNSTHRTIGAHQQELEFLMTLAGTIGGQDNFDEIYDNILKDTVIRLEGHPCSLKLVAPKTSTNNHKLPAIPDSLPGAPRDVRSHTIRPNDPLLSVMLDRLETFFINPVDTNLSLTETIFDLAVCGFMNVEGWLLRHPDKYVFIDNDEEEPTSPNAQSSAALTAIMDPESPSYAEFQTAESMKKCRRRPQWSQSSLPRLLSILQLLSDNVVAYRQSIPRFDDLLQQRREAFQTADSAGPAGPISMHQRYIQPNANPATPSADHRPSLEDNRGESPARPSALEGFAQRILSEFGTPSRSGSPRGRKESNSSSSRNPAGGGGGGSGAGVGGSTLSGGYGFATPTSSKPMAIPSSSKELPLPPYETPPTRNNPLGGGGRSYSPSSQRGDPSGASLLDGRDGAVASQLAAFQAIDQKILARRVGLPGKKVDAIPLSFDKSPPRSDAAKSNGDGDTTSTLPSENGDTLPTPAEEKTVSVSHVITNVIILQSFLLELASLLQVRAGLFDEVRYV